MSEFLNARMSMMNEIEVASKELKKMRNNFEELSGDLAKLLAMKDNLEEAAYKFDAMDSKIPTTSTNNEKLKIIETDLSESVVLFNASLKEISEKLDVIIHPEKITAHIRQTKSFLQNQLEKTRGDIEGIHDSTAVAVIVKTTVSVKEAMDDVETGVKKEVATQNEVVENNVGNVVRTSATVLKTAREDTSPESTDVVAQNEVLDSLTDDPTMNDSPTVTNSVNGVNEEVTRKKHDSGNAFGFLPIILIIVVVVVNLIICLF